jgi:hypothetical protein
MDTDSAGGHFLLSEGVYRDVYKICLPQRRFLTILVCHECYSISFNNEKFGINIIGLMKNVARCASRSLL